MNLLEFGILLIFIGFFLMMVAVFLSIKEGAKVEGGGAILIGPIPIVFGTSKDMLKIVVLILLVILLALLLMR